ncbi:MAG: BtpA family membrane complex biogenesis protein [Phycisphaeraceae bacterium]|nr:MAG: BtpA family membrane complex biogenesis protein [Phycisphaeraceae bacterium]
MSARQIGFARDKALIGMIHVHALPGAPRSARTVDEIADIAAAEAELLAGVGFDGLMIENMHDAPYLRAKAGPEIVACMTRVGMAVRAAAPAAPLGVQILAGANIEALAVAHAIGAIFIRVENFVFSAVADEGLLDEASAGPLLRERRRLGAGGVRILADIKKKHSSHALTADVGVAETARAAAFFGADGVIITGGATGEPTSLADLDAARNAAELPTLVGSGATDESLQELLQRADAVIVGSWIKRDGLWSNPIDHDRAARIVEAGRG